MNALVLAVGVVNIVIAICSNRNLMFSEVGAVRRPNVAMLKGLSGARFCLLVSRVWVCSHTFIPILRGRRAESQMTNYVDRLCHFMSVDYYSPGKYHDAISWIAVHFKGAGESAAGII